MSDFCWIPPQVLSVRTFFEGASDISLSWHVIMLKVLFCCVSRRMATMPLAMGEPGKKLRILRLGRTSCRWLFSADSWVPAKQLCSSTSWRPSTPKRTSGVTTNKTNLSRQPPNTMILEERSFSAIYQFLPSCNSFCSTIIPKWYFLQIVIPGGWF